MYPMLERVEAALLKNVLAHMGNGQVKESLQKLNLQLKTECKGDWCSMAWRNQF